VGPTPYVEMVAACVRALPRPAFPARVRFFRDMGGVTSLTCVAVGPDPGDGEPEVVGMALVGGAFHGPQKIIPEMRQELLAHFD
jgi:hypothetical protein